MKVLRSMKVLILGTCALALVSCATNIIPQSRMLPRLQYTGFSMPRPPSEVWFALLNEQDATRALFRRQTDSPTHTLVVSANMRRLPRQPTSPEDLAKMEKEYHKFQDTERFQLQDLKQTIGIRQGQWCIYFEEKVLDRKPEITPRPLIGRARGFVCLHPSFPKTVVFADCTERGLENELSDGLLEEGQAVLDGIQLESEPGKSIGQEQ